MYASRLDTKVGDVLVADDGFDCLKKNEKCVVNLYYQGGLYVRCDRGYHFLEGQLDKEGFYVGFTHV